MVQSSVYTCNNVLCKPGSRNVSQAGRGCLVGDQGGSDKVAQFKIEGRGSGPTVPPLDPRIGSFLTIERLYLIGNNWN